MFLVVDGDSNAAVTNNTVSMAHVTITGNTASLAGGECVVGDHWHRPVLDPSRT